MRGRPAAGTRGAAPAEGRRCCLDWGSRHPLPSAEQTSAMDSSTAPRTGLAKLVTTLPRLWSISLAAVGESIAHHRRSTLATLMGLRIVFGRALRYLRKQPQQRAGDPDRL